jgi:hypothetical protein
MPICPYMTQSDGWVAEQDNCEKKKRTGKREKNIYLMSSNEKNGMPSEIFRCKARNGGHIYKDSMQI